MTTGPQIEISIDPRIVDGPDLAQPPVTQGITVSLAIDEHDLVDHLVVTFAKPGQIVDRVMVAAPSTSRLLYEIERQGQNVSEPCLIAIADDNGHARRVFVTPCPEENFRDYAVWVGLVSETINNLKARNIAVYPCHGALSEQNSFELISQLVRALVSARSVDQVALVVGRYSYGKMLNMAIELKNEMHTEDLMINLIH